MLSLFDDYFIIIFTQIIPIIQTIKAKYEYLVPFWQIIFTSQQSLFDDYLMIIWWLFDNDYHNYLHYVNYLIHTISQKNYIHTETHPFSLSPGYAASRYPWSGLHYWQRLPLICLIPHCKASPVFLDVGDEYCTHARTRTRHYSLCICNSRIALSAGFAFDLFGAANWRRIRNLSKCNASEWARWLPLAAFTVAWTAVRLENALLWPTSKNARE